MAPTKKSSSDAKARSSQQQQKVKGENFYRDAKQVRRLKMLSGGKAVRDRDGKILQAAAFQKGEDETTPGRVQPDRRWFGNTRVISQTALDHFRTSLQTKHHDPYSVLLRRNKLPMQLLDDAANPNLRKRSHIVETEPFAVTFGPKAQRKRPRIDAGTFEELGKLSAVASEEAAQAKLTAEIAEATAPVFMERTHADYIEPIYAKGTSRRIYGELYKVIDSSDVVLHVLDARDPLGTLCESVLEYIRKEKAHKQVVLARYIQHLTPRYPTIAFHASPNHSFGKGSLIQLLRQFSQLHSDKKQISVGFIGYPNVGKSSVINTLKSGKVCRVAPVPGETKVWQYITLTRRIYLIDCPGIVPTSANDSQTATVLKGVLRVEALPTPSEHLPELLMRAKPLYLAHTYGLNLPETGSWKADDFLDMLARANGRLLKGGEPDIEGAAKIVLSDWVRGRVPYFVAPPERPSEINEREAKERARLAKNKGKGDVEERRVPGVKQNLGSIMQKNTFVGEDVRSLEGIDLEGESVGRHDEEEGDDEAATDGDDVEEEQDVPLAWGDVFVEEKGTEEEEWSGITSLLREGASVVVLHVRWLTRQLEEHSDDESELPSTREKEIRMTTSKRKAENFYTNTNVKNKNRAKVTLLRSLRGKNAGRNRERKKR
ncbi:NUC091 domain-containing protein [Russula earlei]|uniref:NUC091 domain-containing protein n=1 Tax=Russula earlei TaxID=71964 RepID=A0ACC0UI85_9AGAM|nr:NUC091 domain-containing protein [Russula earlei]